jgi:hypothetical protein
MSARPRSPAPPRASLARRALEGAAWTLAWTLAWGCALMMFAHRAQAAPLTLAVASGPVSLPICSATTRSTTPRRSKCATTTSWR